MNWKPIVVGVDGSPESVRAAVVAAAVAQRAGVPCIPVSAVPDYQRLLTGYGLVDDLPATVAGILARDRVRVQASLNGYVPDAVLDRLEVRAGRAPKVLADAVRRLDAGLVVVGAKHHGGLGRLRRRLVSHLVRTCDVPVLVSNSGSPAVFRVLAALDLSWASRVTFESARAWAQLFAAHLRLLHVIEPMPMLPGGAGQAFAEEYYRADEHLRETGLWSEIPGDIAEKVVGSGHAADVIAGHISQWRADLLVIGSHGHGWVDRLIVGGTMERLLDDAPPLMLIVPVGHPARAPDEIGALPWEQGVVTEAAAARA